jgi:hypothetical protein
LVFVRILSPHFAIQSTMSLCPSPLFPPSGSTVAEPPFPINQPPTCKRPGQYVSLPYPQQLFCLVLYPPVSTIGMPARPGGPESDPVKGPFGRMGSLCPGHTPPCLRINSTAQAAELRASLIIIIPSNLNMRTGHNQSTSAHVCGNCSGSQIPGLAEPCPLCLIAHAFRGLRRAMPVRFRVLTATRCKSSWEDRQSFRRNGSLVNA